MEFHLTDTARTLCGALEAIDVERWLAVFLEVMPVPSFVYACVDCPQIRECNTVVIALEDETADVE